jgi:sugar phosphate isomerase/epimerase
MSAQIALQLYTVRDALAHDFAGVIRRVAAMGYAGVETAGFPNTTPAAAAELFRSLGLAVAGMHVPLPLGDQQQEALETADALGCRRLVVGYVPPEQVRTADDVRRLGDAFNEANIAVAAHGLSLGFHNHWWEFQPTADGSPVYEILRQQLDPSIFFELDTYWIKTAGGDPAAVVADFGARAPLLHIKDGPAVTEEPMVAVGAGTLDVPAIVRAGAPHTEWLIVELDRCATDMLTAVEQSYHYLKGIQ